MKLTRNAIECAHCHVVIESQYRHNFVSHVCEMAGKVSKSFNHDTAEYVDDYPQIFVDGGLDYMRTGGSRHDFIDRSEWE